MYRRITKTHWTSEYPWTLKLETRTPSRSTLDTQRLQQYCNKPTTLYWTPSAQPNNRCPLVPFGCIYREWFRCHGGEPAFEFGAFFANPVRIMPTGPTTISDILDTHKALCSEVSWKADSLNRCYPHRTCENACPHPQNYRFLPLCRAVIVVLDEYADDSGNDCEDEDGYLLYDKLCISKMSFWFSQEMTEALVRQSISETSERKNRRFRGLTSMEASKQSEFL